MNQTYQQAIKDIESSGGNYGLTGPVTRSGDRAYGAYQVMGANVPEWTRKHYGTELTPQQFLQNKEAQDAVFNGEFGSYVNKYGNPQDAASAWFTGRPLSRGGNASDGYITGNQYVDRFNKGLAKYGDGSALSAIDAAAGVQPQAGTGALSFAPTGDGETPANAEPTSGMLSADNTLGPGALNGRVMSAPEGNDNKLGLIGQGLTGVAASLASISNPQQAYALNQQLASMKKDNESKYKVAIGKNGEIIRVDQDGNVDVAGGPAASGGATNAPQMTPVWGNAQVLGADPTKATPAQKEAFLQSMPGGQGEMVRAILENRLPPPTAAAMSKKDSPYPAAFAAAAKLDPTVDATVYGGRVAGQRDLATKGAESARALNQTIAHQSEALIGAMRGLDNTGMPLVNDVKNWFSEKVAGSGAVPGFRTSAHAVVDELGKVFKQNNLSDTEIRKWEENLPADMSPPQQRTQIRVFRTLMAGAMDALENKRKQQIGEWAAAKQRPFLSEEGAAGLKRLDDFAAEPKPASNPAIDHSAIDAELKRRGLH